MKKLILCLALMTLPLLAWETWLGMVAGTEGDLLILVDGGDKIYVPGLSSGGVYIDKHNNPIDPSSVTFPFTAMLIKHDESESRTVGRYAVTQPVFVQILQFYDIVRDRLVER